MGAQVTRHLKKHLSGKRVYQELSPSQSCGPLAMRGYHLPAAHLALVGYVLSPRTQSRTKYPVYPEMPV